MIELDGKIFSKELLDEKFACELSSCQGMCCVIGDSGAPVTFDEVKLIKKSLTKIKKYMSKDGLDEVNQRGVSVIDSEGDLTTTLVNDKQCSFVFSENGINKCSIEKAFKNGDIDFNKPISCHLFPVRITEYEEFDALNVEKLKICNSGYICGKSKKIPLYKFLKEALIRKFGKYWYEKLDEIAKII